MPHPRSRRPPDQAYDLLAVRHLDNGDALALVFIPRYGRLAVYVDRQQVSGRGIDSTVRAAIELRRPLPPPTDWSE